MIFAVIINNVVGTIRFNLANDQRIVQVGKAFVNRDFWFAGAYLRRPELHILFSH